MRFHFDTGAPAPIATTPSADDRSTAFRAVQGGSEMQSGEKLLVEAYAALWLILFGLVFLSWRRQKAIDARVFTLEGELAKVRAAGESRKSGGT
ncbi:MAG: CcmD family protein [Minicystis sp.]